ncbi:LOW QUALITY PROTEIN: uncharacterized protein LOC142551974 [Primulina tabacum]|uniref:LOW QUALITY PROTEIN: uncharacterized protein LOC142551974 n=1 Tax=Primulina tabacum TaxID=48773 RepID=UPI003F5A5EF9
MDQKNPKFEPRRSASFDLVRAVSFPRRLSLSQSFHFHPSIDVDSDSEAVSEVGDIGDRAFHSNRGIESDRNRLSLDIWSENGTVVPIQDEKLLQPSGFICRDPTNLNYSSPVSPLALDIVSPLSKESFIQSEDKYEDDKRPLPRLLEYISCLLSLAVFGILGVLARYCLQKLFGPQVVGATSDQSYMYPDLPSNMLGSFLMGWFGVVFKASISKVSDQLAIGLTTGFLGSLTTFSGWNQKMLDLSVNGEWVFAVLGILIGLLLVAGSIAFGIETAKGFGWLCRIQMLTTSFESHSCISACTSNRSQCLWTFTMTLVLILGLLWGVFGSLEKKEFDSGGSDAQLFLACIVGPFGVWIRWWLARFNGRGLGKNGTLKWIPFGTLAANVLAACIMAALATLKKVVKTATFNTAATGIQFGLLGCLSTVSTFIAEFHAMRQSKHVWRSYAYAALTFLISFVLGTLIYLVPVWTKGYN